MKTLLILILLAAASTSWANPLILMGGPSAAPTASYLVNEEYGAQGSWTNGGSGTYTLDYNNNTDPLNGVFLRISTNATSYANAYLAFTAQSSVYAAAAFRRSEQSWGATKTLFVADSSGTYLCQINISDTGAVTTQVFDAHSSSTIATYTATNWDYLRLYYVAGTAGTSATCTGWFSADGSNWGTPQTATATAGASNDAARVYTQTDIRVSEAATTDFDRVRVSTSAISY